MWQLGTRTVDNLGLPSLQNCFRRNTEFWTNEGVKSFNDFKDGDSVKIRGKLNWMDATVKNFGKQQIVKLTLKYMVDSREIFTTANHRWLVKNDSGDFREVITSSLQKGDHLARSKNFNLVRFIQDFIVESVEETGEYEDVWCVVEPLEGVFTLADGILTRNCAFSVIDDPVRPFTWAMDMLMLGCGVGYRLLPEDVAKLPVVKYALVTRKDSKDADFIVPDSREGWVKLLGKVLKAHFYSGQNFTYSCTLLRSKGAPIKSFGGLASGPEVLCDGLEKISGILNKRVGQKLRSVDALDIMNIIGMIVVSGNVRRSAQLAIGDCKDKEFLQAKDWSTGSIPNWRAYSNNSIVCNDINEIIDNEEFWKGYEGNGEPYGLINLKLSRSCGRLGDFQYPDPNVDGYNP
jgi:hypothetical protein